MHKLTPEAAGFDPIQLERELNFAINKITERKIFSTEQLEHKETLDLIKRKTSVMKKKSNIINWMDEYSDSKNQNYAPATRRHKRKTEEARTIPSFKHEFSFGSRTEEEENDFDGFTERFSLKKATSIRSLYQEYERIEAVLTSPGDLFFNSRSFNLFKFADLAGRETTLPLLMVHLFLEHQLIQYVNEQKFSQFLTNVQKTYRKEV